MPAEDRIGLPVSVDRLIGQQVDAVMADLERRYSQSLAGNRAGKAVMAKVVRRATVSGLLAQLDVDGRFVGQLPEAGPGTWESWQGRREQTLEGTSWPPRLASTMPDTIAQAGTWVAKAGAEVGLRERRAGDARTVGEQSAEAGGALVRCLTSG